MSFGLFRYWKTGGGRFALREKLVFPRLFYYSALVTDVIFRLRWSLQMLPNDPEDIPPILLWIKSSVGTAFMNIFVEAYGRT